MEIKRDLYKILSVPNTATQTQIKKAFYRLAVIWHPDKNNSVGSVKKYEEISEAYNTLYDTDTRAYYDLFQSPCIDAHFSKRPRKSAMDPLFDFSKANKEEDELFKRLEKIMQGIDSNFAFSTTRKIPKQLDSDDVYSSLSKKAPQTIL